MDDILKYGIDACNLAAYYRTTPEEMDALIRQVCEQSYIDRWIVVHTLTLFAPPVEFNADEIFNALNTNI